MKKNFKYFIAVWAVLLALFHIIAFVSVGWEDQEKYTVSFWIGYAVILFAFIGQLFCAYKAFKAENSQKLFYNIPLIRISYTGLILSFIFGGLCMLIPALPYWVGIILCALLLAFTAVSVIKGLAAADIVSSRDDQVKMKTAFLKGLTADAEGLMEQAASETMKISAKKVYEAVRSSDPVSSPALEGVEAQIADTFSVFSSAVAAGDEEKAKGLTEEILRLLGDRNKKCRLAK